MKSIPFYRLLILLCLFAAVSNAQTVWQANLDGKVRFYQTTDFGVMIAGTDNSLYAVDGQTGEIVWRKRTKGLDETSIVPVPSTDLILVSSDEGDKSRVEAVDLLSGATFCSLLSSLLKICSPLFWLKRHTAKSAKNLNVIQSFTFLIFQTAMSYGKRNSKATLK